METMISDNFDIGEIVVKKMDRSKDNGGKRTYKTDKGGDKEANPLHT
jgi:hypothetical protein